MAEVKFKFVGDDSELRKKLANLARMQSEMTDRFAKDFGKTVDNGLAKSMRETAKEAVNAAREAEVLNRTASSNKVLEAKLAQIEAFKQARLVIEEERAANQRLKNEYDAGRISLQKFKEEQYKLNAERKEQAKIERDLKKKLAENSEYGKLAKALNTVRKEAKEVLTEMFRLETAGYKNSAGYAALEKKSRDLVKQTNILDGGIKKIDATLGQHQRNVGNYTDAIELISPQIADINQKLALFGTSLDQLSSKSGGVRELGNAFLSVGKNILAFVLSPVGLVITALAALFGLLRANKQTVFDFNSGLRDVSKTTGIVGQDLRDFGSAIVDLSMKLKVVDATKLLEYASIAGQLGVKGRSDILAFTEALAMLETASDIRGEDGGKEIARMLTLVDGGVQNVKAFGDEIVNLGNNFAASEKEILGNAEAISQNVGIYKVGRQDVLAYAAATKSLGIEAEVVGSTFQKTLGTFEKSIRSGKGVADILSIVGGSAADLQKRFSKDATGVFQDYIKGLNGIHKAGGNVNEQMDKNGIVDIRQRRVIGTLAVGYDTLARAMNTAKDAGGAMQEEFENGAGKLVNQWGRMSIAWKNFVLSIEDGEGAIGRSVVAIVGFFAELLDQINKTFNPTSLDEFMARLNPFGNNTANVIREVNKAMEEGAKAVKKVGDFDVSTASQSDLKDILKETTSTINELTKAHQLYKKSVEEGVMTDGGKNTLKDFEDTLNFLRIRQANLTRLGANQTSTTSPLIGGESDEEKAKREKAAAAAKQRADRVIEQQRQAVERQRDLQGTIDALNVQSTRGQLSRDEQEIASVKDKYRKIREEVRKFYADPRNKGQRVDTSGLPALERFETEEVGTRQGTAKLVKSLNEQKAIYDEYNRYLESTTKAEADKRYSAELEIVKSYKDNLRKEYMDILSLEKSASTGGSGGKKGSLTQAQEERAKALKEMIDAADKEERAKVDANYVAALQAAQTYSDKLLAIEKDYHDKVSALGEEATAEQIDVLTRAKEKAASALASDELVNSDAWMKLFSNLDELAAKEIGILIKEIESKFETLSVQFDPIDLDLIRKKLNEAKDVLISDNPFAQVGVAIKNIMASAGDDSKDAAKKTKVAWKDLASSTQASFDFVADAIGSAEFLKDAIGEVGNTALTSMMAVASTSIAVAAAIKTAEKASVVLAIVQAALVVVNALANVFKSIFAAGDKRLEKSIQSTKVAVEELDRAFQQLDRTINNSVGDSFYADSQKQINNLKEQAKLIRKMQQDEEAKKKTDKGKVSDYKNQLQDIDNKIEDIGRKITETLVQTSFKELSDNLTDALVSAFEAGESAIGAMDKTFDGFIKNAVTNSLKLRFIEPIVNDMITKVSDYMLGNNNSLEGYNFDTWREKLAAAGADFTKNLDEAYKGLGLETDKQKTKQGELSKGIAGITEPQANRLEAEFSGVRLGVLELVQVSKSNHVDVLRISSDKIGHLVAISNNTLRTANNTEHLSRLEGIETAMVQMNSKITSYDSAMRAGGFGGR